MEAMAKLGADASIPACLRASKAEFVPILTARQAQIKQTTKKTFKYGPTDRHQLDVYYPVSGTSNAPIFFFVYGGAYTTGARDLIPGLVYDNVGSFFAQRGILTIIPDHRLAPETLYPGPAYDTNAAVQFALTSPEVNVVGGGGDKERVYLMGHSSGGAHVSTMFLNEDVLGASERAVFKGAVLNGAAYESAPHFDLYYGEPKTREAIDKKTPLGLLKAKSPDRVKELLPSRLLFLVGEYDEPVRAASGETFKNALREKGIVEFQEHVMKGHNHISSSFALNAGEGEEWGEEVVKWLKA